jgi:hypothetical protein
VDEEAHYAAVKRGTDVVGTGGSWVHWDLAHQRQGDRKPQRQGDRKPLFKANYIYKSDVSSDASHMLTNSSTKL